MFYLFLMNYICTHHTHTLLLPVHVYRHQSMQKSFVFYCADKFNKITVNPACLTPGNGLSFPSNLGQKRKIKKRTSGISRGPPAFLGAKVTEVYLKSTLQSQNQGTSGDLGCKSDGGIRILSYANISCSDTTNPDISYEGMKKGDDFVSHLPFISY